MKILRTLLLSLTLLALVAGPALAFAAPTEPPEEYQLNKELFKEGPTGILEMIEVIIKWIFTFLMVVAVIVILFAAFTYLTSSGDEEKVSKAHKMLLYTAVAVAVGLLSYGIINAVQIFVEESAG